MFAIFSVQCSDCHTDSSVKYSGDLYMKKLEDGCCKPEDCGSCGSTKVNVKKIEEQR